MIDKEKGIRWIVAGLFVIAFVCVAIFAFIRPQPKVHSQASMDASCEANHDAIVRDTKGPAKVSGTRSKPDFLNVGPKMKAR